MTNATEHLAAGEIAANHQGRVTIPSPIRQATGIQPGTPLKVYEEDGRVVIETREHLADRIRRDVRQAWRGSGSAVDELLAERRQAAAEEEAEGEQ